VDRAASVAALACRRARSGLPATLPRWLCRVRPDLPGGAGEPDQFPGANGPRPRGPADQARSRRASPTA